MVGRDLEQLELKLRIGHAFFNDDHTRVHAVYGQLFRLEAKRSETSYSRAHLSLYEIFSEIRDPVGSVSQI